MAQRCQLTRKSYDNLSRAGGKDEEILFFGLQYILKEYFTRIPSKEDIEEAEDIFKAPKSDLTKSSKKGKLGLTGVGKKLSTFRLDEGPYVNLLEPVFENGKILREQTFTEIRNIANNL